MYPWIKYPTREKLSNFYPWISNLTVEKMSKNTCENLALPVTFLEKQPVKNSYTLEIARRRAKMRFHRYDFHWKKDTDIEQTSLKKGLSSFGSLGGISASTQFIKKGLSSGEVSGTHFQCIYWKPTVKPFYLTWQHSFLDVCVAHFKVAHLIFFGGGQK